MTEPTADGELLAHVLLPVAHEADARESARALSPYDPDRVTVLHVVEKGDGVPDKTPVEKSREVAAESYAAVRETFPDADDHTAYARDVVSAILEAADEVDASAVAYRPREGGRIVRFLSGDHSLKLVTRADRPVIALPTATDETDS
ncbi:universal stress protein [Natrialbaceae archaeon AArc-T1-2]|uniref:universal stress protein n=1 Tax=Natrialbaceae archaeon AArc-T1-2 TaxID=3053904 RepID=UPI00255A97DD|nr:universal stress protein [Natrialbaceae archaeon AArc-T1-2]WIV68409.1 universal stress protein [Natrialbaceae archaeon AArc-T1-2]